MKPNIKIFRGLKIKGIRNNRGSSFIGALFLILLFGFSGISAAQLAAVEKEASSNEMQTAQALYVSNAGLEYAINQLDNGYDPVVNDKSFGNGQFTITTNPDSRLVTSSGSVGNAKKTQSIYTDFSKHCVTLDTSTAYADGANLRNIKLIKTCNTAAIVSKIYIDWNWPSCSVGDDDDDDDDYSEYADPDNPGKIFVCHAPSGNPDNEQTLSISISSWENGHSSHSNDYLGPCGGDGEGGGGGGGGDDDDDVSGPCDDSDHDNDHTHHDALISMIVLEGTTIYDPTNGVGSPAPFGAEPTEEIDVVDYTLTANGTYTFEGPETTPEHHILFNKEIIANGWYKITVEFDDETQIYSIFTL